MKNIILCADDYGQNPTISQAIIDLVKEKRLSAVSCLTNFPDWQKAANWLHPFRNDVSVGLHFNLTQGTPLSPELKKMFSLKELLLKSQLRNLNKSIIVAELRAQLEKFFTEFNRLPDFIDGHQHIHQFPIIRDALFEVYEERLRDNNSYVRCTYNRSTLFKFTSVSYFKQIILLLSGGFKFKRELELRKIPHNTSFSGIYDFSNKIPYEKLFTKFLSYVNDGGMIMCHPGLSTEKVIDDEIYASRPNEFEFFAGNSFLNLLGEHHAKLINKII